MNKRLKELRKALKMNQAEFGASLEMLQTSYSAIETGAARITDKNIALICLKHGVNETWLRTGLGDMFTSPPDGPTSNDEKRLLEMFRRLVPEMRLIVLQKVREMLDSIEKSWAPSEEAEKGDQEKDA